MTLRSLQRALVLQVMDCTRGPQASPPATKDAQPTVQVSLCPKTPPRPGVDDLRFSEDQFTAGQFDSSYAYFEAELPHALNGAPRTSQLSEREGVWIRYAHWG